MKVLDHQNTLKLFEVYETDNSLYLIMDYLAGGPFSSRVKRAGKIPEKQAIKYMLNILLGIQHMTEKGVMHRDLKPDNIMIRTEKGDDLVIVDFGLASFVEVKEYIFSRCGTPGYVAPEIANLKDPKGKYTAICDVFSAGIIMHLIEQRSLGKSPFSGKSYNEVLTQNRACDFKLDGPEFTKLNPQIQELLIGMLEKDPSKRMNANQALCYSIFQDYMTLQDFDEDETTNKSLQDIKSMKPMSNSLLKKKMGDNLNLNKDSCVSMAMRPALFAKTPESVEMINSNMNFQGSDKSLTKGGSKEEVDKSSPTKKQSRFAPKKEATIDKRVSKLGEEYKTSK